jgi:UDP-glucuronate 4-epimerase
MNFLVTGGAGFIGSHLCERLISAGHHVLCLDNFNTYYDPGIKRKNIEAALSSKNYRLIEGDILDWSLLQNVFRENRFDGIVHLAARAGVRPSIKEPRLYQKVNVEGSMNLLELSVRNHINKFIFASSSSVYGNNKRVPFSESDPVDHPISPYAATKKAGELIASTYCSLYPISITCLRFFTVYGERQRPDMAIHKFTCLIDQGKEIPVFGDGTSRRDYTYIHDILDGIQNSIDRCNGYKVYNLGNSRTIELDSLIRLIEKNLGKKAKIKSMPVQPGDVPITYADISLAEEEIDYHPNYSIEQGIKRFVAWYRKYQS